MEDIQGPARMFGGDGRFDGLRPFQTDHAGNRRQDGRGHEGHDGPHAVTCDHQAGGIDVGLFDQPAHRGDGIPYPLAEQPVIQRVGHVGGPAIRAGPSREVVGGRCRAAVAPAAQINAHHDRRLRGFAIEKSGDLRQPPGLLKRRPATAVIEHHHPWRWARPQRPEGGCGKPDAGFRFEQQFLDVGTPGGLPVAPADLPYAYLVNPGNNRRHGIMQCPGRIEFRANGA